MPRYFFHFRDHIALIDDEGVELRDLAAARALAVRQARAIAGEQCAEGRLFLWHRFDISGEDGGVITSVTFGEAVAVEAEPR